MACLKSLAFTDEQLVIDSGSTDKTIALAHEHKAKVIPHAWEGYGAQKNFGIQQAKNDWVLFVDADEQITVELRDIILATLADPQNHYNFFWLRIVTVFLGKPLRHLYGHNPRLFRKSAGHWTADYVHEQVQLTNGTRLKLGNKYSKLLPGVLLHYSHDTIRSYLNKMRHYTTLEAKEMRRTGTHRSGKPVTRSLLLPWRLSSRQFIKLFFYRHGWKDGRAGCIWCVMSAYYEFELGRKFL